MRVDFCSGLRVKACLLLALVARASDTPPSARDIWQRREFPWKCLWRWGWGEGEGERERWRHEVASSWPSTRAYTRLCWRGRLSRALPIPPPPLGISGSGENFPAAPSVLRVRSNRLSISVNSLQQALGQTLHTPRLPHRLACGSGGPAKSPVANLCTRERVLY